MAMMDDCPTVIMPLAFHCKKMAGARRFESCLSQWASSESFPDRDYLEDCVTKLGSEVDQDSAGTQMLGSLGLPVQ